MPDEDEQRRKDAIQLGNLVRSAREGKGWSQEALASEAFANPDVRGRISTIELATGSLPKPETVRKLASVLQIEPSEIPTRFLWPEVIKHPNATDRKIVTIFSPFLSRAGIHRKTQPTVIKLIFLVALVAIVSAVFFLVRSLGWLDVPFEVPGRVDCAGGGGANANHIYVKFEAPSGAEIVNYTVKQGHENYGSTGKVKATRNEQGKIVSITVKAACDPPGRLGAPGGENNVTLVGVYRK